MSTQEPPVTHNPNDPYFIGLGAVDTAGGAIDISKAEHQVHLAWARLTRAWGHRLPQGLNKMTFYRARLKKVVS